MTLPASVTEIGEYAFAEVHFSHDGDTAATFTFEDTEERPSQLRKVGKYAFDDASMSALDIPKGVKEVGEGAFRVDEYVLTRVSCHLTDEYVNWAPDAFGSGDQHVFYECLWRTPSCEVDIHVDPALTVIPKNAFGGVALRSFHVPASVERIEEKADAGPTGFTPADAGSSSAAMSGAMSSADDDDASEAAHERKSVTT